MNLDHIHKVYFVGIGGIGISALARFFRQRGLEVAGYDRVQNPFTTRLELEGMDIHYEDDPKKIPASFLNDPEHTVVIFTPAVPATHRELTYLRQKDFVVMKRSEMLGILSRNHRTVAIGGTHGKTTTSSMVAHIFHQSIGCSAFVGGVMTNYDSNLIVGDESAPVVVEADEFDRSFHRLSPDYAIVTSVDPDHLDIYGDEAELHRAYGAFLKKTSGDGRVLIHVKAAAKINMQLDYLYYTYGIDAGDFQAKALRVANGIFYFNYHGKEVIKDLSLMVPGFHNVENATAAITVALEYGISPEQIKAAIATYKGVKRRFEYIIKTDDFVFIDDYAHHPAEIAAFLRSVKSLYPARKVTAIFQPHLYSRTNDFQKGFAESLEYADEIILLDIYPAREEPIPGVTSQVIYDKIHKNTKVLCSKELLLQELATREPEVLVTIGAGDIDQEVPRIKAYYSKKANSEA